MTSFATNPWPVPSKSERPVSPPTSPALHLSMRDTARSTPSRRDHTTRPLLPRGRSLRWAPLLSLWVLLAIGLSGSVARAADAASVSGWEAMAKLQSGNKRFLSGNITWRPDPEQRAILAGGQHPHSIILSCSDSRVPPELLFDQGLGEIFVVRVAGNVADANAIASIEYAIEHLGARLVVVMGHESCGAVKAALTTPRGSSAGSPSLDVLVKGIQKNLDGNVLFNTNDKTLVAPVKANVGAVFRTLIGKSPIIREMLEKKELVMAQAVYSLASGEVSFFYAGIPEAEQHEAAHEAESHEEHATEHRAPVTRKPVKKKAKPRHAPRRVVEEEAAHEAPASSAKAAPAAEKAPASAGAAYYPPSAVPAPAAPAAHGSGH